MSLFRFCRKVWPVAASLAFIAFLVYGAVRNWPTLAKVWKSDVGWKSLASEIHRKLPDKFYGKAAWIDGNGLLARLLSKRYLNDTMKFRGGLLGDLAHPRREVAPLAKELVKWDKLVKSLGGRYLYVQAPLKLDRQLEMLLPGCDPALNDVWDGVDELMRRLDEAQVPHLDLSPGIADNFEQLKANFYRTDHHWRYEAAFAKFPQVAKKIAELAGKSLPDDLPQFQAENWEKISTGRDFLGSQGRRTGLGFAGCDEFVYYVPKFATEIDLVYKRPKKTVHRRGTFKDSIVDPRLSDSVLDSRSGSRYSVFIGSDFQCSIVSLLAPCKLKLMIIKDSYALPMIGFLSTVFSNIEVIDPRYFDSSIPKFVTAYSPEVMMTLVNVKSLREGSFFAFDDAQATGIEVLSAKHIDILSCREATSNYKYMKAQVPLKAGAHYRVSVGMLQVDGAEECAGDICLYDEETKKRLEVHRIYGGRGDMAWMVDVPPSAVKPRLYFYAGKMGECMGNSARYEDIVIEEILKGEK